MASASPLREEEKGREGAAAQPSGLFCVGRLPLPVSSVSAAVGGCRLGGMPACRPLGLGMVSSALLPPSAWPGASRQPCPRPIWAMMGPGTPGSWPVLCPNPTPSR